MPGKLHISTLGGLSINLDGQPVTGLASRKTEALLVYLACTARAHPREVLSEFFWEERTQERAMGNLRTVLASLRKELRDFMDITRETAAVNPDADIWLDVHELMTKFDCGLISEGINLYHGPFLDGFFVHETRGFEDWMYLERERIQRKVLDGLNTLVNFDLERGAFRSGIENASRLLALDPLDENAHRQMMLLLACIGQRAEALTQYETCRQTLISELGLEPSQEIREVYDSLLNGERPPGVPDVPSVEPEVKVLVGECPYRGLAAFQEQDAAFFFGREGFAEDLYQAVVAKPMVAVIVGSSGSGKSSTVFAGLLPRLRDTDGWKIVQLRPGKEPFQSLSTALLPHLKLDLREADIQTKADKLGGDLAGGSPPLLDVIDRVLDGEPETKRLLLVVDQFEELYTLCPDAAMHRRYLDMLLDAVTTDSANGDSRFVLLLTMRADFMGQALAYRPFADALQEASLILGPMNATELRLAIEKPAELQGAAFEAGLVERLLDDVGQEPGNLPLLEFALTLLWDKQNYGWMTHTGYEKIGRVEGALASYADQVYADLEADEKEAARRIFIQLVSPGTGTEDTRRMATKQEIVEGNWALVQHLADKRLVVTGRDPSGVEAVEVVHEALIQKWDKLRDWIEGDRAFRTWQERLRAALTAWKESGRDQGALLRGLPLAEAVGWEAERGKEISPAESEFIAASLAFQTRRQMEREHRRRSITIGLAGGMVVALVLAGLAWMNWQRADDASLLASHRQATAQFASTLAVAQGATAQSNAEARATAQNEAQFQAVKADAAAEEALQQKDLANYEARAALEAYSLSLAANAQQALDVKKPGTALVLAMAANDIENPPQPAQEVLRKAAFSPGARRLLVAEEPHILAYDIAISPDGKTAVTGLVNGELSWWDLETGREVQRVEAHSDYASYVAYNPDGTIVASAGDDGLVIIWDVNTKNEISRFDGHELPWVTSLAFSPDGNSIVSGGSIEDWDVAELILWDVETGEEIHRFEMEDGGINDVAFHPDGSTIYSVSDFAPMREWDVESGEMLRTFEGPEPEESLRYLDINQDEGTILAGGWEAILYIWDIESGELLHELPENIGNLFDVAFIPHSRMAISSYHRNLVIWDLITDEPIVYFEVPRKIHNVHSIAVHPDGRTAFSVDSPGKLIMWDLYGADEIQRFDGHTSTVYGLELSPDGKQLISGAGINVAWPFLEEEYTIRYWDIESGEQVRLLEAAEHVGTLALLDISSDGSFALTSSGDNSLWVWDLESGTEKLELKGHTGWTLDAQISADDRTALSASWDLTLILWDLETGDILHHFIGHNYNAQAVALSPDGRTALSGAMDTTLILWDLQTGEQLRRFFGHTEPVFSITYTSDGSRAVSSGRDGNLILWDVATGQEISRYTYPFDVRSAVFTPDERQVLAGTNTGLILWDIESGEVVRQFYGHTDMVISVVISEDGNYAFSGGQDFTIRQWQLSNPSLDELLEFVADNRYLRELNCEERELYKIDEEKCKQQTESKAEATPEGDVTMMEVIERPHHIAQIGENRGEISLGDFDIWTLNASAGDLVTVRMLADNPADDTPSDQLAELGLLDTLLILIGPDGSLIDGNDNGGGDIFTSNSLLEKLELPLDGEYRIEARSCLDASAGEYTLVIENHESE